MKKFILCLSIIALLSGCDNDDMMSTTCTNQRTYNGLTSGVSYIITHDDEEVERVKIVYDYNQDTQQDGVNTGTDGTTSDNDNSKQRNLNDNNNITNNKTNNTNNNNINNNNVTNNNNDNNNNNDGIIDGVVGDTIDDIIGGIYDTIIDLSGLKTRHTNQMNNTNIEGFTSKVENDTNTSYKVTYNLDLTKINDNDIKRFNVDRNYKKLIDKYTDQGLTCK